MSETTNTKIDLDLDALQPGTKVVHLCGKELTVFPPRLKHIIRLVDLNAKANELSQDPNFNLLKSLRDELIPLIPGLGDEDVDITFEQLQVLVEFVMSMATPSTVKEMQDKGITPSVPEKKTDDESDSTN